jgi:hypothetical protein
MSISPTSNSFVLNNNFVSNKPLIQNIENKYAERFDNASYYHGGGIGSVDGGDLGDGDGDGDGTGIYDGGTYEG